MQQARSINDCLGHFFRLGETVCCFGLRHFYGTGTSGNGRRSAVDGLPDRILLLLSNRALIQF